MEPAPKSIMKIEKESDKGIKYSIEIKEISEYLNIKIISQGHIPCKLYEKNISLSDVKNNRYLSICTNVS